MCLSRARTDRRERAFATRAFVILGEMVGALLFEKPRNDEILGETLAKNGPSAPSGIPYGHTQNLNQDKTHANKYKYK